VMSPGKSPPGKGKMHLLDMMKGTSMGQNKLILDNLPKVERGGFDVEAKIFHQVQKEYEEALAKKRNMFDIADRAKHTAVIPLLSRQPGQGSEKKAAQPKLGMSSKMVLPSIPTGDPEGTSPGDGAPDGCSSQAGPDTSVKTLEEVHKLLPEDFHELKQMMELHHDLKSQMARNKEQMARMQETGSGEDNEMMDLLRKQISHVVMMMKDVLDRMESYPEQLWALYGAVEAYEKCSDNTALLEAGQALKSSSEELGPQSLEEHHEALRDIYSHILEGVHAFLAETKDTTEGSKARDSQEDC